MPTAGTCRPSSVTSVARGRSSPCCISWRTRIEPMLQNISCASPVAASTATLTPGKSTRASCPCETLASSSRSRRRNDCDCAVMRASIRHLLLNRVLPPTAHPGSCARGVPPSRGCNRTGGLGYHITFVLDRPSRMSTRPRLTRPPRILIASDQNHALWDLEGTLGRQGYSVLRVFAGTAVLARARSACPDVILLDARLADSESLDLSRLLRADPLIGSSTPILLLVHERPSREDHHSALRAGVWELLRQPVDAAALLGKLEAYLVAKIETERAPKRSLVDELTGLYTRRGLAHRAWELILQTAHHNTSVACVVVAPEVRGDPGDGVLRDVARLVRATARHSDAVGRVGLTEFAVVAPGANRLGARRLAQRLQGAGAAHNGGNGDGTGNGDGAGVLELRAGYDSLRQLRTAAIEPRRLLGRAARALEMARAEGKWLREGARARES